MQNLMEFLGEKKVVLIFKRDLQGVRAGKMKVDKAFLKEALTKENTCYTFEEYTSFKAQTNAPDTQNTS